MPRTFWTFKNIWGQGQLNFHDPWMHFYAHLFVLVREENISHRWKYLLQQLHEQKELLGNISGNLSVLRDIELVCLELKELQVRGILGADLTATFP